MIDIEKQVKITLDGNDARLLQDVCELARRILGERGTRAEFGEDKIYQLKNFICYIFDNT